MENADRKEGTAGEEHRSQGLKKNLYRRKKKKASTRLKNSAIALKQVRHSIFMSISGDIAIFGGKLSFNNVLKRFVWKLFMYMLLGPE